MTIKTTILKRQDIAWWFFAALFVSVTGTNYRILEYRCYVTVQFTCNQHKKLQRVQAHWHKAKQHQLLAPMPTTRAERTRT